MFLDFLCTGLFYFIGFIFCCYVFVPLIILVYLPHSSVCIKMVYAWFLKISSKLLLFFTFLPVTYQGFERLPQGPVIFIANHQSVLDIFLVENVIGSYPSYWVAKSELLDYPLLSQVAYRSLIPVPLKTSPIEEQKSVVAQAIAKIKSGYSVVIFPEGGRFVDGFIHPFYSGFAAIAKETGAPVVPLFISGTGRALPPGRRLLKRTPLMITVGNIFTCEQDESVNDFKDRVFNWFVELNWRRNYLQDHFGIRICNRDDQKNKEKMQA